MAIESVGAGSAASYQTATADAVVKPVQQAKDAQVQQTTVANTLTKDSVSIKVNSDSDFEQSSDGGNGQLSGEMSQEEMHKKLAELNKSINKHTECKFDYHEKTKRFSIKIVDKDTQEVIREVPPEKLLDMIAKTWELAGLLVDEKR